MQQRGKPGPVDASFRQSVNMNIENVVRRAEAMACKLERDQLVAPGAAPTPVEPVVKTVTNLLSTAMNPTNLVKMTELYQPWF